VHFFDKVYHQEHFLCTGCDVPLKKGNISEWESKPMCIKCYGKLPKEVIDRDQRKKRAEEKFKKQQDKEAKAKEKEGS